MDSKNNHQRWCWAFIILYLFIAFGYVMYCITYKELTFYDNKFDSIIDVCRRYPWTIIWGCLGFSWLVFITWKYGIRKSFQDTWFSYLIWYPIYIFVLTPLLIIHLFHEVFPFSNYSFYFMSAITNFYLSFRIDYFNPNKIIEWIQSKIETDRNITGAIDHAASKICTTIARYRGKEQE